MPIIKVWIYLTVTIFLFNIQQGLASDIYLSASQVKHTIPFRQQHVDFDPIGVNALASFDVTAKHTISFNYGLWTQGTQITESLQADIEVDTYGFALTYYFDDAWYGSVFYDHWQDNIHIQNTARKFNALEQKNRAYSYTGTLGWGTEMGSFYYNVSTTIQSNKWESDESLTLPKTRSARTVQEIDTTFASIALDASRYAALGQHNALIYGVQVSWHQLVKDNSITALNTNPIRQGNTRRTNSRTNIGITDHLSTDSYGQARFYTMLLLGEFWTIDVSFSQDFSSDTSGNDLSIGLGYQF